MKETMEVGTSNCFLAKRVMRSKASSLGESRISKCSSASRRAASRSLGDKAKPSPDRPVPGLRARRFDISIKSRQGLLLICAGTKGCGGLPAKLTHQTFDLLKSEVTSSHYR